MMDWLWNAPMRRKRVVTLWPDQLTNQETNLSSTWSGRTNQWTNLSSTWPGRTNQRTNLSSLYRPDKINDSLLWEKFKSDKIHLGGATRGTLSWFQQLLYRVRLPLSGKCFFDYGYLKIFKYKTAVLKLFFYLYFFFIFESPSCNQAYSLYSVKWSALRATHYRNSKSDKKEVYRQRIWIFIRIYLKL